MTIWSEDIRETKPQFFLNQEILFCRMFQLRPMGCKLHEIVFAHNILISVFRQNLIRKWINTLNNLLDDVHDGLCRNIS